jgi:hypothetical protein
MLALNISGLEQILSTFAILNMKVDVWEIWLYVVVA